MSSVYWDDKRIYVLRDMWCKGYSARQIAQKLGGVTRNAVIGKANRLGLSQPASAAIHPLANATAHAYSHTCQWPEDNPDGEGFILCGNKAVSGKPYCRKHCEIAYRRVINEHSS